MLSQGTPRDTRACIDKKCFYLRTGSREKNENKPRSLIGKCNFLLFENLSFKIQQMGKCREFILDLYCSWLHLLREWPSLHTSIRQIKSVFFSGQMTHNSQTLPLTDDPCIQINTVLRPERTSAALPGIDCCVDMRSGSVPMGVASINQCPN